jgi:predicted enzyme related to lactoylglutathione lyase
MVNTWDWVEIRVANVERAAAFFEVLFGWKVVQRVPADGTVYCIFDTGGIPRGENLRRGGLWLRPQGQAPAIVPYILVLDIEAALRQVQDLGGAVVSPPRQQGTALCADFRDPEGNLFGLWQEKGEAGT